METRATVASATPRPKMEIFIAPPCTLYLVRGIPGSAKMLLAKGLSDQLNHNLESPCKMLVVEDYLSKTFEGLSPINIVKAHTDCRAETKELLTEGTSVIVVSEFATLDHMRPYYNLAKMLNVGFHIIDSHGFLGTTEVTNNMVKSTLSKMESVQPYITYPFM